MKTHEIFREIGRYLLSAFTIGLATFAMAGQNSLPAPGAGGSFRPNTGPGYGPPAGLGPNGIGWNPGPGNWGSPWSDGWSYNPTVVISPVINSGIADQGITKVVACGYDAQGIWRVIPLTVSYQFNGIQYVVNVLNAWNPWTDRWDRGVDVPAYNTDYWLRGQEFGYYAVLPTGTFYFNL